MLFKRDASISRGMSENAVPATVSKAWLMESL